MTTLTVNITDESRLVLLKETLAELGFDFSVNTDNDHSFSDVGIASFLKTRQDYLESKTSARSWEDMQQDLDRAYN